MIKRQGKLLNSKKKRADEQKSSVSLKFTDSDRMKAFNQVVKENLGWVLSTGHKSMMFPNSKYVIFVEIL